MVQGREAHWNETALRKTCPFRIADVALNAIYAQACDDMSHLAGVLNFSADAKMFTDLAAATRQAMQEQMWNSTDSAFRSIDLVEGKQIDGPLGISNIMALVGGCASSEMASKMVPWLQTYCKDGLLCAASLDPASALYQPEGEPFELRHIHLSHQALLCCQIIGGDQCG